MSSIENRKHISEKLTNEIIPACCNGNKSAEAYLNRIFFVVRTLDDLYDGDVEVKKEDIAKAFFIVGGELYYNSFFKENIETLMGLQIVGFNAWKDANVWEKSDNELKRIYAHVIRDFICELFSMVAFLTGGTKSMNEMSIKVREFFLKELGD